MIDMNELARRCMGSATDDKTRAALQKIMSAANTADGKQIASSVPSSCAKQIEQAAQAAQRGDKAAAMQAVNSLLATPDGAKIAKQLKFLMGRKDL